MNIVVWVVSALLALVFLGAGFMKLSKSREELAPKMHWVNGASAGQVKAVGLVEVLGALGLILPALTGIAPVLTPLAALGLFLVMAGAVVVHVKSGDAAKETLPAVVLGLLSLFVAWARFTG